VVASTNGDLNEVTISDADFKGAVIATQFVAPSTLGVVEHMSPNYATYAWYSSSGTPIITSRESIGSACAATEGAKQTSCIVDGGVKVGDDVVAQIESSGEATEIDSFALRVGETHELKGLDSASVNALRLDDNGLYVYVRVGEVGNSFVVSSKVPSAVTFHNPEETVVTLSIDHQTGDTFSLRAGLIAKRDVAPEAALALDATGDQVAYVLRQDDTHLLKILARGERSKWTERYSKELKVKTEVSVLHFVTPSRVYVRAIPDFQLLDLDTGDVTSLPSQIAMQVDGRQISADVADWACQ
jgi:hypothetical protein